jgi:hypothetical protein
MIIVQQAVAPVRNRKEKGLMVLKEKSLQVFTDPENPNHENQDLVARMLG